MMLEELLQHFQTSAKDEVAEVISFLTQEQKIFRNAKNEYQKSK